MSPTNELGKVTKRRRPFRCRLTLPAATVLAAVIAAVATLLVAFWPRPKPPVQTATGAARPVDRVYLLGSGTVYHYLQRHAQIEKDQQQVPLPLALQGGSKTGVLMFSDAVGNYPLEADAPMLAMSAERLTSTDFIRHSKEMFAEFWIGEEELAVSFGATDASTYRGAFGKLSSAVRNDPQLGRVIPIASLGAHLARVGTWHTLSDNPPFKLFVPNRGSATLELVQKAIQSDIKKAAELPKDLWGWDLRVAALAEEERYPWIAIGVPDDSRRIDEWVRSGRAMRASLVDASAKPLPLPLYLYARLRPSHGAEPAARYYLDASVLKFLRNTIQALERDPETSPETRNALVAQAGVFHLFESSTGLGWISESQRTQGLIFRYAVARAAAAK